jgi:hypothetical protein
MTRRHVRNHPQRAWQRGAASVEYLAGVLVVALAVWMLMSDFGQGAIQGIKLAGLDLLGLK